MSAQHQGSHRPLVQVRKRHPCLKHCISFDKIKLLFWWVKTDRSFNILFLYAGNCHI